MHAEQEEQTYCKTLPQVVQQAYANLPAGDRFPCDAAHIVHIRDLHAVMLRAAGEAYAANPRYKAIEAHLRELLGFTFASRYPIYLNIPDNKLGLLDRRHDPTAVYRLACVLVHENVHAGGNGDEVTGYEKELSCLKSFKNRGRLPARFDFSDTEMLLAEARKRQREVIARAPQLNQ